LGNIVGAWYGGEAWQTKMIKGQGEIFAHVKGEVSTAAKIAALRGYKT